MTVAGISNARLEGLARKYDVLAAMCSPLGDDLDNQKLQQEHIDTATALRTLKEARGLIERFRASSAASRQNAALSWGSADKVHNYAVEFTYSQCADEIVAILGGPDAG